MVSTCVEYMVNASARAGSTLTLYMHTITYGGANTVTVTATAGTVAADILIEGDLDGFLDLPFADYETMKGLLQVSELKDMQILLTEAAAGGVTALIAERIYTN